MKVHAKKYISAAGAILMMATASCVSEAPFESGQEGTLRLTMQIREEVKTRAAAGYDSKTLSDNCVIYIESKRGVVRKFLGLDNVPATVSLKPGEYVVEGWTGDSVSASFDKKFYRGYQNFTIEPGQDNAFLFVCNIANVLVAVSPESLTQGIEDLNVTFSHSKGALEFDSERIVDMDANRGYFMMPNADKNLNYKISGTLNDGSPYIQEGVIPNVQRAHKYTLNLTADPSVNPYGGGAIKISIEDEEVVTETFYIYDKPSIVALIGDEFFDLGNQIVGNANPTGEQQPFRDVIVRVRGYEGLTALQLRGADNFASMSHPLTSVNLLRPDASYPKEQMNEDGIWLTQSGPFYGTEGSTTPDGGRMWMQYEIKFEKKFFDNLVPKDTEYKLDITATDFQDGGLNPKTNTVTMHIATTDKAVTVQAPVQTDRLIVANTPMAVLAHSATLSATIRLESASGYGIKYRKKGDSEWIEVPAASATADKYSVTIANLTPATTYEYKAYASDYDNCNVYEFTTESIFQIPNASMEEWSEYSCDNLLGYKQIVFPGTGSRTFWDSGNQGAGMASAILTDKSAEMHHSGSYSAKLTSKDCTVFGAGKFAAGNLFAGTYVKTDGTDGVLSFGREYNGSHPTKMTLWANYRPAVGSGKGANSNYIASGQTDQGQIYVALSTQPVEILTKNSEKLFDPNGSEILAYGQVTWDSNFGPDGALQKVEIPLTYYDRAKTTEAKCLIIVCSASKYGDYFSGGPGSVMYLDDFELVYE